MRLARVRDHVGVPTVTALAILLGFGALVVLLGLLVRLVARAAAPRVPRGPATPELIDTPPAVVNLLMNGLRAAPEAAAATLLHLAARRHLELDQPGADPAATIVRVRSTGRADLTASEQRVLDRVEAPPGVHPLTLGDLARRQAQDGQGWQERLLVAARADAAARGLIQPGRSSPAFAILVAGLMLVLVLSCVAGVSVIELAGLTDRLGSNGYAIVLLGIAVLLTLAAIFAAVGIAGDIRDERRPDRPGSVSAHRRPEECRGRAADRLRGVGHRAGRRARHP